MSEFFRPLGLIFFFCFSRFFRCPSRPRDCDFNRRFGRMTRMDHLHVRTRAPRPTEGANPIKVPTHPPIPGVLGPNECAPQPESVLGRHTARGYVQWMVVNSAYAHPGTALKLARQASDAPAPSRR